MADAEQQQQQSQSSSSASMTPIDEGRVELGAAVRYRRTKGRNSLKRLSDIMSAYIPMTAAGAGGGELKPLLEAEDGVGDFEGAEEVVKEGGYRLVKLLHLPSLSADSVDLEFVQRDVTGVAISDAGLVFVAFEDSPNILRLRLLPPDDDEESSVSKSFDVVQVAPKGLPLVPTDVRVRGQQLLISGAVCRQQAKMSVVVRCDLDGKVLQVSKELPDPKFFGFDVDEGDQQLVMASPSPGNSKEAQIFKMSDDFKRKVFKIELGRRSRQFRPEFVACQSDKCWVSTQVSQSGRCRLLSFPLRPPPPPRESQVNGEQQQQQQQQQQQNSGASTKSWLRVSSWKFEQLQPGRLLALPATSTQPERLLVLDREQGNIFCLNDSSGCSALTHPSSEGGQQFTSFCCLARRQAKPQSVEAVEILATTRDSLYLVQVA